MQTTALENYIALDHVLPQSFYPPKTTHAIILWNVEQYQ